MYLLMEKKEMLKEQANYRVIKHRQWKLHGWIEVEEKLNFTNKLPIITQFFGLLNMITMNL